MFRLPMQQTLEELLIQTKLISQPQLAVAQRDAGIRNKALPQTLIELGFVTDRKFAEWVAGVTKLPLVDPIAPDVVSDLERYMPRAVAREYEVIPIDAEADEMTVAMVNPMDKKSVTAIQDATGMKIHPVVGVYGNLRELVNRFYPEKTFDPSATIAAPLPQKENDPFDIGSDTLLRHSREALLFENKGDDSLGSETRVAPPKAEPEVSVAIAAEQPAVAGESQLDRIERHINELLRTVEALRRRIDAIDSTLARIVNRQ